MCWLRTLARSHKKLPCWSCWFENKRVFFTSPAIRVFKISPGKQEKSTKSLFYLVLKPSILWKSSRKAFMSSINPKLHLQSLESSLKVLNKWETKKPLNMGQESRGIQPVPLLSYNYVNINMLYHINLFFYREINRDFIHPTKNDNSCSYD